MGTEGLDDRRLEAWGAFLQTHAALVGVLEREMVDRRGLPLTWYEVLLRLARTPQGAMRMQELARSVLLSKSGVTRVVDRMESAGLVERQHCANDRRGTYAAITDAGRSAFRAAVPVHLAGIHEHFGRHLSGQETDVLLASFQRMIQANESDQAPACDAADGAADTTEHRAAPGELLGASAG